MLRFPHWLLAGNTGIFFDKLVITFVCEANQPQEQSLIYLYFISEPAAPCGGQVYTQYTVCPVTGSIVVCTVLTAIGRYEKRK